MNMPAKSPPTQTTMFATSRFVFVSFVLGLLMSFVAMGTVFQVRLQIMNAFDDLRETRDFQANASAVLRYVIDFEAAYRGFLITGNESTLEPLTLGRNEFEASLKKLEELAAPNTGFVLPVTGIISLARATSRDIIAGVAASRGPGETLAQRDVRFFAIAAAVNSMRRAVGDFDMTLQDQLVVRRQSMKDVIGVLLAAIAVMLTGLVLSSYAVLKELRRQGAAAEHTGQQNADTIASLSSNLDLSRLETEIVNRRLSLAIRSAKATVFTFDRDGVIHWTTAYPEGPLAEKNGTLSLEERTVSRFHPELRRRLDQIFSTNETLQFDIAMTDGELGERWLRFNVVGASDGDKLALGSAIDITDIRRRESANLLLMRELSHRSKNLLAIVQAMARQTARATGNLDAFQERFAQRLRALAASHDLLVKNNYSGASLRDIIRAQLADLANLVGQRIFIEGPDIFVQPEAAQTLGMAFHELGSNARLFGALSKDAGTVNIQWSRSERENAPVLILDWIEQGAPVTEPATKSGFGSTLILKSLPRALHGEVELIHSVSGTRCHMVLDLTMVEMRADPEAASPV